MVLPEMVEAITEAVPLGVYSAGHRNGAVPECADAPPTSIDRDLLRIEIRRHLKAIGLNGSRSNGTLSKDVIREIHRFHREAARQRIHRALGNKIDLFLEEIANGDEVDPANIRPGTDRSALRCPHWRSVQVRLSPVVDTRVSGIWSKVALPCQRSGQRKADRDLRPG